MQFQDPTKKKKEKKRSQTEIQLEEALNLLRKREMEYNVLVKNNKQQTDFLVKQLAIQQKVFVIIVCLWCLSEREINKKK